VLRGLREFVVQRDFARRSLSRGGGRLEGADHGRAAARLRKSITALVRLYIERLGQEAGDEGPLGAAADDETFVNFFATTSTSRRSRSRRCSDAPTLAERAARLRDVLEFRLEELRIAARHSCPRTH